MRVALYTTGEKARELALAHALFAGGVRLTVFDATHIRDGYDLHCIIGVTAGHLVRQVQHGPRAAPWLFWDKGYNRDWPRWWRVSAGAHQPVEYIARSRHGADRAQAQGWVERLGTWSPSVGKHVLLAGGSPNYHAFAGLAEPTTYARDIVAEIRKRTDRPIVYRPKPQWREAEQVEGAAFSHQAVKTKGHRIATDLDGAQVMVTHGSNACLEAALAGVPIVALGRAATRSMSSTSLDEIEVPRVATREERLQVVSNIAYCQWSLDEIAGGLAWPYITEQLGA